MTRAKNRREAYDRVVLGGGIFGCYGALGFAKRGLRTLLIEKADDIFTGASYVNQARIHSGYHYPRSLATAQKTRDYVERFASAYPFAVDRTLLQIYAIAKKFSYTNASEFEVFCKRAHIRAEPIDVREYFDARTVESAYRTTEYGFYAERMRRYVLDELKKFTSATLLLGTRVTHVERAGTCFVLTLSDGQIIETPFVLNATYAGLNATNTLFGVATIPTKYELAELALCHVPDRLHGVGLTVMDGPFFSLMPFGDTGLHSLSAVSYTPHRVRAEYAEGSTDAPTSHFAEMNQIAKKFLADDLKLTYARSLYATKAIPRRAELDDARPTLIEEGSSTPRYVSVLSGKLNTLFDLDTMIAS